MEAIPSWATGTCNAHIPPHPACHKCNKEIVRLKDMLDSRTHALIQAVSSAAEGTVPPKSTVDKWADTLGWEPLTDEKKGTDQGLFGPVNRWGKTERPKPSTGD